MLFMLCIINAFKIFKRCKCLSSAKEHLIEPDIKYSIMNALPDDFSRMLFEGALRVAADAGNPVRGNLYAAGMRELMTYCLHHFAPDNDVKAAPWFVQCKGTNITREQRIRYATQRGLSDDFMESVDIDVKKFQDILGELYSELNKATHPRPKTILNEEDDVRKLVGKSSRVLDGFLGAYKNNLKQIKEKLGDDVYRELIMHSFSEIDILSGRGYEINSLNFSKFDIELTATDIAIFAEGDLSVTLHYGGRDEATGIEHGFPFSIRCTASTNTPKNLNFEERNIDSSSWFQD